MSSSRQITHFLIEWKNKHTYKDGPDDDKWDDFDNTDDVVISQSIGVRW